MAHNHAILNNVYNYYFSSYTPRSSTRYDSHKKSELCSIYNRIVKLNKDAPLYKMDTSRQGKTFAIGIKEDARTLHHTIASLGGLDEEKLLNKKIACSSNEDLAIASFIGELPEEAEIPSYEIEVRSLAGGQVNIGHFLADEKIALPPDTYSFDININDLNYEFQYNIREGESVRDIQNRLARLIANANIGIEADVIEDGNGNAALRLSSVAEGTREKSANIFIVSDNRTSKKEGTIACLGLDQLARPASDAEFLLNGEVGTSSSNSFVIDRMYEVTLRGISSSSRDTAQIGLKTDIESLVENVSVLVDGYNHFIHHTASYCDDFAGSRRLLNQMHSITKRYHSALHSIGLQSQEGGTLSFDRNTLTTAILSPQEDQQEFSAVRDFANSVANKMTEISLNPMDYVDKTIIAYKNPGKNYANPYMISTFSGMLFNYYC